MRMVMVHRLYRIWMRCQPGFTPRSKPLKQGSVLGSGVRRSQASARAERADAKFDKNLDNTCPPMDRGRGAFVSDWKGDGGNHTVRIIADTGTSREHRATGSGFWRNVSDFGMEHKLRGYAPRGCIGRVISSCILMCL